MDCEPNQTDTKTQYVIDSKTEFKTNRNKFQKSWQRGKGQSSNDREAKRNPELDCATLVLESHRKLKAQTTALNPI